MRVLVCGGRKYSDVQAVHLVLNTIHRKTSITEIIEGGALGADRMAREWAKGAVVKYTTVHARWDLYGKAAGYRRNVEMANMRPDLVVAFPGGKGTAMMMNEARKRGIKLHKVELS